MSELRLRIEGTPDRVEACAERLAACFAVIESSRDYPNRGGSLKVRRYIQIDPDAEPTRQEAP